MKPFTDQKDVYSGEGNSIADAPLSRKYNDQEQVHKSVYILSTNLKDFSCFIRVTFGIFMAFKIYIPQFLPEPLACSVES